MGRIVVSENLSLDGVVQDPTGDEGTDRGGWFTRISAADRAAWGELEAAEAFAAEALLFGRRGFEFFAARWPARSTSWANRLNTMPKYVVTSTLTDVSAWGNTTILGGDMPAAVSHLKDALRGDIVVYASGTLVRALLEHDLVDELRLTIFPVIAGAGTRLFGETAAMRQLTLINTRTIGDGLAHLVYQA